MKNAINTATATAAELLAFYNANSGLQAVKRFADRASGAKRVDALLATLATKAPAKAKAGKVAKAKPEVAAYVVGVCPACGATEDITCGTIKDHRDGTQTLEHEDEAFCHGCGHEFNWETGRAIKHAASSAERSAAIAKSWQDPTVAAARAERTAVFADGIEYGSTAKAFRALGLSMTKHIAIRMQLKALGKLEYNGHKFAVAHTA